MSAAAVSAGGVARGGATVGAGLLASAEVAAAIDAIVGKVRQASAQITDVRPPREELRGTYEGMMKAAADARGRALLYPYIASGAGNGALVELADGSVKWDMITGIGVHFMGHAHPELIRAGLLAATEDTAKHGNLMSGNGAHRFCVKMVELASRGSKLRHCFPTTSGAMANENALKVCFQKHAPANRVLAFRNCFMGRSTTMATIGDSAAGRQGLPTWQPVDYMPFWNDVAVEKVGGPTAFIDHSVWRLNQYIERWPGMHACFIFELAQGEGGFNTGPREFFKALMDVCRAKGIAIWDDEIQTFGRTGRMFAYETYDLGDYVDVFCVGKMTQLCATMYTEAYNPKPGLLSGTFTGSSQDFAVGLRVLELLDDSSLYGAAHSASRGRPTPQGPTLEDHHRAFREQAGALRARHPEWFPAVPFVKDTVDGIGGMMRFTPFGGDKDKVNKACKTLFDAGVIVFYCGHGPYHLRMLPPLGVMRLEDWPRVFSAVERGLAAVG